jgi:membrane protein DedA with SNARE-associated domain
MTARVFATITAAGLALWALLFAAVGFVPWSALPFLGGVVLAGLSVVVLFAVITATTEGEDDAR